MRVALVSTGLGRVLRGFESFTESLFQVLQKSAPHIDVTLFQGGGERRDRRIVVPNCHRDALLARLFGNERGDLIEKRSFALALYPMLRYGQYDLVHYNELVMGCTLFHLRRYVGGKYKLLYCNGAPSPPIHYHHRCDFAQILTEPDYRDAREFGLEQNQLFLIPYGLDSQKFSPEVKSHRSEIRHLLRIPEEAKVVLSIAALKREHKRLDYLMKEISTINDSIWFLAAGQRTDETPSLEKKAEELLHGRWRFVTWPYDRIALLYGAADVFVHASLTEAFGLVIAEAMLSGLPVVIHNAPVFKWIAGDSSAHLINMSEQGELSRVLIEVLSKDANGDSREEAVKRFSWNELLPRYLEMYQVVETKRLCDNKPRGK
jgi:1,2-diacylglycerol 3-alpha-glucosyltransferase